MKINKKTIKPVKTMTFLSLIIAETLKFEYHTNLTCKKRSSYINVLRRLSDLHNTHLLLNIYCEFIHPHLKYGIALGGGGSTNRKHLFLLQKMELIIFKKKIRD